MSETLTYRTGSGAASRLYRAILNRLTEPDRMRHFRLIELLQEAGKLAVEDGCPGAWAVYLLETIEERLPRESQADILEGILEAIQARLEAGRW